MNEWFSFISEVGFPSIVTLILLYRMESKLDQLIQSIDKLPESISYT